MATACWRNDEGGPEGRDDGYERKRKRKGESKQDVDLAYERARGSGREGKDPYTMRAPWNKRALSPQKEKQAYRS